MEAPSPQCWGPDTHHVTLVALTPPRGCSSGTRSRCGGGSSRRRPEQGSPGHRRPEPTCTGESAHCPPWQDRDAPPPVAHRPRGAEKLRFSWEHGTDVGTLQEWPGEASRRRGTNGQALRGETGPGGTPGLATPGLITTQRAGAHSLCRDATTSRPPAPPSPLLPGHCRHRHRPTPGTGSRPRSDTQASTRTTHNRLTCVHTHACARTLACAHAHTDVLLHTHVPTYLTCNGHTHTYAHTCIPTCPSMYTLTYARSHIHIYSHINKHTCSHTHSTRTRAHPPTAHTPAASPRGYSPQTVSPNGGLPSPQA